MKLTRRDAFFDVWMTRFAALVAVTVAVIALYRGRLEYAAYYEWQPVKCTIVATQPLKFVYVVDSKQYASSHLWASSSAVDEGVVIVPNGGCPVDAVAYVDRNDHARACLYRGVSWGTLFASMFCLMCVIAVMAVKSPLFEGIGKERKCGGAGCGERGDDRTNESRMC